MSGIALEPARKVVSLEGDYSRARYEAVHHPRRVYEGALAQSGRIGEHRLRFET
jgi:hypothetical protein